MKYHKCDKCGTEMDDLQANILGYVNTGKDLHFELCLKCYDEISDFIKGFKNE